MTTVRRRFLGAADRFDAHRAVFDVAGERLSNRLEVLAMSPARVLDLGCRSGYQLRGLSERYPQALVVGCDPAAEAGRARTQGLDQRVGFEPGAWLQAMPGWLRQRRWWPVPGPAPDSATAAVVTADPHRLPFADGSFDLVISNLLLPWSEAPPRLFAEVARVLDQDGAFFFTSAGPDTLQEYRAAWAAIDGHLHGFGLIDMHDLGDDLLAAGFAAPVLDRQNLTVDYPSIDALQAELQSLGAGNLARGRRAGLMAPSVRTLLHGQVRGSGLEPGQDQSLARFPVTLELVQGHAWKGELTQQRGNAADEFRISVESLRGSRHRPPEDPDRFFT